MMQFTVFDDMSQCNEQEVARLLNVVSKQRREQALQYQHLFGQFCCLKSYEMLISLLTSTHHIEERQEVLFLYNEHGQPRIEGGPCFSISHCKHGIAVAASESPIGIDIEHVRTLKPELVTRTMNDDEQQQIFQSGQPEWEFTRLWTMKEALLKMRGTGIISDLKNTLVATENVRWQTKVNTEKRYVCSLVFSV